MCGHWSVIQNFVPIAIELVVELCSYCSIMATLVVQFLDVCGKWKAYSNHCFVTAICAYYFVTPKSHPKHVSANWSTIKT